MKFVAINLFAACLFYVSSVIAHDIGIAQTDLIEQEPGQFELSVRTGALQSSMYETPILPEHCNFNSSTRGVAVSDWLTFKFVCEGGLTAEDTLRLPWPRDGVMIAALWLNGTELKHLFRSEAGFIDVPLAELQAGSGSQLKAAIRYTSLGIEHILLGIDHLLFVLALLLLVRGAWPLLITITGFTIAHSITLGLATLGFISVSSAPVEAAIALSIAFVCAEIINAQRGKPGITYRYPWVVSFAFGLLHGLGFAGALARIGLPPAEVPIALLFFNIGVEIGQLLFIAAVLVGVVMLKRRVPFRGPLVQTAPAFVIGVVATFWFLQRTSAIFQTG